MEDNQKKYLVGKIKDYTKHKGWFFGHFADEKLLKSDLVEVAWQDISNKNSEKKDKHLHSSSVEINLVISGEVAITINGKGYNILAGEFYVIWPNTIVENLSTTFIVINADYIWAARIGTIPRQGQTVTSKKTSFKIWIKKSQTEPDRGASKTY